VRPYRQRQQPGREVLQTEGEKLKTQNTLASRVDVIHELNADLYDQTDGCEYIRLSLHTDGNAEIVELDPIRIWDSETFCDDEDSFEELLVSELEGVIQTIKELKFCRPLTLRSTT